MTRTMVILGLVAVACALGAQTAAAPPGPMPQKSTAQPVQHPDLSLYHLEKHVQSPQACTTGSADTATRRVWAARLGCAGTAVGVVPGFELVGLKPSTALSGVKISATFEVTRVLGTWWLVATLHRGTGVTEMTGQKQISNPGTYTVVSDSTYTLDAGLPAGAMAYVYAQSACGDACAIALKITEIKWLLP